MTFIIAAWHVVEIVSGPLFALVCVVGWWKGWIVTGRCAASSSDY